MNLTPFERLTLSIQLRRLAEENPDFDTYKEHAEIIENGYTTLYGEVFGSTAEAELDRDVQEEVFEILTMFRALHPGHEAGASWDPQGNRYYQKFRGFDGNSDEHYRFARFLIEETGRFEESGQEYNSHSEVLSTYRAMLDRWNRLGRPHQMTEEQIGEVVAL